MNDVPVSGPIKWSDLRAVTNNTSSTGFSLSDLNTHNINLPNKNGIVSLSKTRGMNTKIPTRFTKYTQDSVLGMYSLKLLNPDYTGPVVNIKRTSDNSSNDFYADINGTLRDATGTLYSRWIGNSTGNVMIWYDQAQNDLAILRYPSVSLAAAGTTNPASTTITNAPYGNGSYTYSADTQYNTTESVYQLFNYTGNSSQFTTSGTGDGYNGTTGVYGGTNSTVVGGQTFGGAWVQLQLPYAIYPTSYYRRCATARNETSNVLAGSIDGSTWVLLNTNPDLVYTDQRYINIPYTSNAYSYYRLIALSINGANTYGYWSLNEFCIYGRISLTPTRNALATTASGGNPPQLVLDPGGSGKYVIYFPNSLANASSYYGFTLSNQSIASAMLQYYTLPNSSSYQTILSGSNITNIIQFINNSISIISGTGNFPPIPMTNNTFTISQIYYGTNNVTYIASASSQNTSLNQYAYNAFDCNLGSVWTTSTASYNITAGTYSGAVSTTIDSTSYLGEWVQLQLPYGMQLSKYTINGSSNAYSNLLYRAPSTFKIAGSTNGTTWTTVDTQTGATIGGLATKALLLPGNSLVAGAANNGDRVISTDGSVYMIYQGDDNFVIYGTVSGVYWAFQTINFGYGSYTAGRITLDPTGFLALYDSGNTQRWVSNSANLGTAPYRFVMRNDRNAVIYDANDTVIWQTNTASGGAIGPISLTTNVFKLASSSPTYNYYRLCVNTTSNTNSDGYLSIGDLILYGTAIDPNAATKFITSSGYGIIDGVYTSNGLVIANTDNTWHTMCISQTGTINLASVLHIGHVDVTYNSGANVNQSFNGYMTELITFSTSLFNVNNQSKISSPDYDVFYKNVHIPAWQSNLVAVYVPENYTGSTWTDIYGGNTVTNITGAPQVSSVSNIENLFTNLSSNAQNSVRGIYSYRYLNSNYNGPLFNIYRVSDTCNVDFYGNGNGNLFTYISVSNIGGSVNIVNNNVIHSFKTVGNSTFTVSNTLSNVNILVVAGGGGGGYDRAAGGGAGGVLYSSNQILYPGSYAISVGGGGAGATSTAANGVNGTNSSVIGSNLSLIAIGGGGGGTYAAGSAGGSGGGGHGQTSYAGGSGTAGQGYAGGTGNQTVTGAPNSGGGGGAGGLGGNAGIGTNPPVSGNGGPGVLYSISGMPTYYGGGGGGSIAFDNYTGVASGGYGGIGGGGTSGLIRSANGINGVANTGGGGGGGANINQGNGGAGGSGIVIISYALSNTLVYKQSLEQWLGTQLGYVYIWYDQSGKSNHAIQTTQASQPIIRNASKRIDFNSSLFLNLPVGTVPMQTQYTVMCRHGFSANQANGGYLGAGITNTNYYTNNFRLDSGQGYWNYWYNQDLGTGSFTYKPENMATFRFDGTTSGNTTVFLNGVAVNSGSRSGWLGLNGNNNEFIGKTTVTEYFNGTIYDIFIFASNLGDTDRLLIENTMMNTSTTLPTLWGSNTDGITFPSGILPSTYTLMHVNRYNRNGQGVGTGSGRILQSSQSSAINWLSGHWNGLSGVTNHNNTWITQNTYNIHNYNWVLSTDQNQLYRSLTANRTSATSTSTQVTLALGSAGYTAEYCPWATSAIVVYNSTLTSNIYIQVEDYLATRYKLPVPIQEGLILSLDAADIPTHNWASALTSTTWNDRSLYANNFVLTNSGIFTYNSQQFPYMDFTGYGSTNSTAADLPVQVYNTFIWFGTIKNTTADYRTLIRGYGNDHLVMVETGTNRLGAYNNTSGIFIPTDQVLDVTTIDQVYTRFNMHVWKLSSVSPYYQYYLNPSSVPCRQTAVITDSRANLGHGFYALGFWQGPGQYFGYNGTSLYYNRELSDEELVEIYRRHMVKYDLPAPVYLPTPTGRGRVFLKSGIFYVPVGITSVKVLVVGGGGGGGGGWEGGGGGGGGVVYNPSYAVTPGSYIKVIVGRGGYGTRRGSLVESGENSLFDTLIAYGGGAGGAEANSASIGPYQSDPRSGGSGGGGGWGTPSGTTFVGSGVAGQGYSGGQAYSGGSPYIGGGGGGAGGVGGNASSTTAGVGGPGVVYTILGITQSYSGGGSGSVRSGSVQAAAPIGGGGAGNGSGRGADATSYGGGGGAGGGNGTVCHGGNGYQGIVIVEY